MEIEKELGKIISAKRIKTRLIDVLSFAADAGFYTLTPKAVVQPINETEIIALFNFSNIYQIPIVFRAAGTSLSGQSITDGLLVDLSQYWDKLSVEQNAELLRVQPGITGGMANSYLKKYSRKIGPDPASINAAMLGGIISNNSSGMCCGVKLNAYHTVKQIRFILPDGKIFATENPADYQRFETECQELYGVLRDCRQQIIADGDLENKIRGKYKLKNTVGYSLNSLIDFEHPLDIFAHLIVGAEGTLAFISEAVLQTVPDYRFKSTALLYFPDIYAACDAIVPLNTSGARAVELMDSASLRAIAHLPGLPSVIKDLRSGTASLLVEFQENGREELHESVERFLKNQASLKLIHPPAFTTDPKEQDNYWKVRKGLFPSVGAVRARGSTVILEDVAFPVQRLGDAILDLQELFKKYGYENAIIFGHAKDGNIHFVITPDFNNQDEIFRYDRFMWEVVELVVRKYEGSLKAEHGTGRNIAPFVEVEWGQKLYDIMKKIKKAADPQGMLNPGVLINDDKRVHIKNIKQFPGVEQEVDKCIECGYCEHKCPSRNITASPRRRIVIRRELQKLQQKGDTVNYKLLRGQFKYDGMETCAVDGLCAVACPVDINTGELIKRLRRENHSGLANRFALAAARQFGLLLAAVRIGVKAGHLINNLFGKQSMRKLTFIPRKAIPAIPLWEDQISNSPSLQSLRYHPPQVAGEKILYYPTCISRLFGGNTEGKDSIIDTFFRVSKKAGIGVKVPEGITGSCCSQIFSSKGHNDACRYMANRFVETVWISSDYGKLKIVIDASSCTYSVKQLIPYLTDENRSRYNALVILDYVDYLFDMVMPKLRAIRKKDNIVLHPVCSLEKMKGLDRFVKLAEAYAHKVNVPIRSGCCGMAGDRGFLFPELTESATRSEALEVCNSKYDGYYSSTRTCEMALSIAVRENYESILYLVDETTEDSNCR